MHLNDIITNILPQFHANRANTIIAMQTKRETLLVISIFESFFAQLKLFCEIFSSCLGKRKFNLDNFRTGTENTTLFYEKCNVLENMRIYSNV